VVAVIDLRPYLPQATGDEPLAFRYVNQGTDWRLGGPIGLLLGGIQRASLVYSPKWPKWLVRFPLGADGYVGLHGPLFALAFPRANGRYIRVRIGWRFDQNIGDGWNLPREPIHDPPGGYFLDWWITRNAKEKE
jgi:hypothetical protein